MPERIEGEEHYLDKCQKYDKDQHLTTAVVHVLHQYRIEQKDCTNK
ncbi:MULTISPECIES: hypothetical protein [Antarcticibacterium]|nr:MULTISPECIES: hypothetical protein [Antarcticibacterium]